MAKPHASPAHYTILPNQIRGELPLKRPTQIPILVSEEETLFRRLPSYFALYKNGNPPALFCRKEENHRIPAKPRRKNERTKIELLWYDNCACPGGVVKDLVQPGLSGAGERHRNPRFTSATLLRS